MPAEFDPRMTPARPDLADAHLERTVKADRFVAGRAATVTAPVLDIRGKPDTDAALTTQLLHGEAVTVYEDDPATGFSWLQNGTDGYVGYARTAGLGDGSSTHRVTARTAQAYPRPALKSPPLDTLPYLAALTVTGIEDGWAALANGCHVSARHIAPLDEHEPDFVAVAERFLGAPYLWGGRSVLGLDCSALVQLSLMAAGRRFPRDSDMQQSEGAEVSDALQRGDLVFWKGHVGIMTDAQTLLHANAHHMATVREPLAEAEARIAKTDGPVTARRRLDLSALPRLS